MNIQFSMTNAEFDIATFCDLFSSTMVHFMWQGTVIALVVWLVACVVFHATPKVRYAIHLLALSLLFVCPPVTFILLAQQQVSLASVEVENVEDNQSKPEDLLEVDAGLLVSGANSVTGSNNESSVNEIPPNQLEEDHLISASSLSTQPKPSTKVSTLAYVATLVYGFGVVGMMIRLLVGVSGSWRLRRNANQIVDKDLLRLLKSQAKRLGLHRLPSFASSSRLTCPVVLGLIRPVVLIPTSMISGMTPADMEAILTHELAHLRRLDLWVNMFQRVAETLLFFHPAVWLVSRRLSADRELCCDDLVLASGQTRVGYASALIRMGEVFDQAEASSAATACAVAGKSPTEFKQRVLRLLEIESPLRPTGSGVLGTSLMSALLFGLTVWSTTLLTPSVALSQEPDLLPIKIIGQVNPRDLLGTVRGFSLDGNQLITSTPDAVIVWNLEDEKIDWQLPLQLEERVLAISPDKRFVAIRNFVSSQTYNLIIYDLQSHQEVWRRTLKSLPMIKFSPADNSVLVSQGNSPIEIYDINDGTKIGTLSSNDPIVIRKEIPISLDGRFVATSIFPFAEVIWDLWTGDRSTLAKREEWGRANAIMVFVADHQLVCAYSSYEGGEDTGGYRVIDAVTKEHLLNLPTEDLPLADSYVVPGVSDDGSLFITAHANKIVVWNTSDWSRKIVLEGEKGDDLDSHFLELAISPDNHYLAVNRGNSLLMWDLSTGESIDPLREKHRGEILDLALSPDESQLVSVGWDGAAFLWDVDSGNQIKKLVQVNVSTNQAEFIDNTQVLISGEEHDPKKQGITGFLQVIDVSTGQLVNQLQLDGRNYGMSVSSDRQTVAIGDGPGSMEMINAGYGSVQGKPKIQVLDTQTFAPFVTLIGFESSLQQRAYLSRDKSSVVHVTESNIYHWDTNQQETKYTQELKSIVGDRIQDVHDSLVIFGNPLVNSKLEKLYVCGSVQSQIAPSSLLWFMICYDLNSKTILWELDLGLSVSRQMKLSPDESILAFTNASGNSMASDKIILADANSGEEFLQLHTDRGGLISSLEFSPDGNRMYAGRDSGDIAVWDISKMVESVGVTK